MALNIVVCIKSVPDPDHYDTITLDPVNKTLVRDGIPTVISGADKNALELALRLKEKNGGKVTVVTMGPPNAREQLLEALALGADEACLITDRRIGGADTLATSYTISCAIRQLGEMDVILAGNDSDDGATSHVPSQLGEWLGFAHTANVTAAEFKDGEMIVSRQFEQGTGEYSVCIPCVLAVKRGINKVRYANVMGMMTAKNKPMKTFALDDLGDIDVSCIGLDGSPTKNGELRTMEFNRNAELIEGTEEEIAEAILAKIRQLVAI